MEDEQALMTPNEYYLNYIPYRAETIFDMLCYMDLEGYFFSGSSIFDKNDKTEKYTIEEPFNQNFVLNEFENFLKSIFRQFDEFNSNYINQNKDEIIYLSYCLQAVHTKMLEVKSSFRIIDFDEIEWTDAFSLDDWDMNLKDYFNHSPKFLPKLFKITSNIYEEFVNSFSKEHSLYLSRIITQEEIAPFLDDEEISEITIARKIVFLNELGLIDSIKKQYAGITNEKIALLVKKSCFSRKDSIITIRIAISRIIDPSKPMSTKANPYNSPKNKEAFNDFIDKWKIDKIEYLKK
ncbi:MAG: hypothetical protein ACJAXV_000324 [Bacteroidia bacterium]|jgi:hypothetical protein|tara:strand:- start:45 stop:923 length:879 start_codon:yes stop_codon:yes gene_type:complete